MYLKDMVIYYSSLAAPHCISCMCNRWDQNDWNIVVETNLTKSQFQNIYDNLTPAAVGELYEVLGKKVYYDMTWNGENTLKLSTNTSSDSTIKNMRDTKMVYVKNISSSPLGADTGLLTVKIEAILSGSNIGGW